MTFCVLNDQLDAPGYREALLSQNQMVLAAYTNANWEGATVPHIDPYKEIQAVRASLGKDSENFPLETFEGAIKTLGSAKNYKALLEQYSKEREQGEELGIEVILQRGEQPEQGSLGVQPAKNGNPSNPDKNKK